MPTENRFKILQSKVQTPELQKHLIIRERLLKKIDGASEKMVILYGTVGYGKTVAMSNYVRIYEVEHAWYHLDVMDNDFWNFLEYLSAAFGTIWKEFCFDVSKYMQMQDDQQMFQQCSRAFVIYLNEFLNRVECGSRRKLLVLDNFQEIQNECIFDFIQRLVEESSEHLKILLATKSSLPTFAAAFVLREKASIIDMEVLAFTVENQKRGGFVRFIASPRVIGYMICIQIPYIMLNSFIYYYVPLYGAEQGLSENMTCLLLMVNSLCSVFLGVSLTDFFMDHFKQWTIYISTAMSLVALLLFAAKPTVGVLVVTLLIMGISSSFGVSSKSFYFTELPQVQTYGEEESVGVYNLADNVGESAGPMIFGSLMSSGNLLLSMGQFVAAIFAAGAVYAIGSRKKNK